MKRGTRAKSGILLVELMVVIMLGLAVTGVLSELIIEAMHLRRAAATHTDRLAAMDALTRDLRRDALAALEYRWDGAVLVLMTIEVDGRHTVRYGVGSEVVVRSVDGAETHVWRAERLQFAARLEKGIDGDLFGLEFIEQPPASAHDLAARSSRLVLVLPRAAQGGGS